MKLSTRGAVDPFIVMDVMEAARAAEDAGRHIIHMEVGQPASGAPEKARRALSDALEGGPLGYTVALGLPELRARIARYYGETHNLDLDPARVVVSAGASGAFLLSFAALFETGARVGLGVPCYPSYRQILRALDMCPISLPTSLESRLQPVPAQVAGLDGLIVASPGNPSGTMLGHDDLAALSHACDAEGAALISDEIYHGLDFAQPAVTALSVSDNVHVINSFSKYFSMTGWRVGWLVVPEGHVRQIERLAQNFFICPSHAGQVVALHAMDCRDELDAHVATYRHNRTLMLEGLPLAGFPTFAPADGAFYVYADVSHLTDDSTRLARQILDEAGVAVTPGVDFDPEGGHHWMRFSYARATHEIEEGLERLRGFMARRGAAT